jgi:hypothetical protein
MQESPLRQLFPETLGIWRVPLVGGWSSLGNSGTFSFFVVPGRGMRVTRFHGVLPFRTIILPISQPISIVMTWHFALNMKKMVFSASLKDS